MVRFKQLKPRLVKGNFNNPIKAPVKEPDQIYSVFRSIKNIANETSIVVYLNGRFDPLNYKILSTGSMSSSMMDCDEIYGYGFLLKASYYILIHNHPGGQVNPSPGDIDVILKIKDGYQKLKMQLLDFIIVGDKYLDENKLNYWSLFISLGGKQYSLKDLPFNKLDKLVDLLAEIEKIRE